MTESKSDALPLGYTPSLLIKTCLHTLQHAANIIGCFCYTVRVDVYFNVGLSGKFIFVSARKIASRSKRGFDKCFLESYFQHIVRVDKALMTPTGFEPVIPP